MAWRPRIECRHPWIAGVPRIPGLLSKVGLSLALLASPIQAEVDDEVLESEPKLEKADITKKDALTGLIPEDAFRLPTLEWIPAAQVPLPVALQFPANSPMKRVEHLAVAGGRLWIAAQPRIATNLPPRSGVLWSFTKANNKIQPMRGMIEQHQVRGMYGDTNALWLALNGGVAKMDTRNFVMDTYSASEGLTTENPVAFAVAEDRLHVLADHGAVFRLGRTGRNWSRLSESAEESPLAASGWSWLRSSGDWLLAMGHGEMAVRHNLAPHWEHPGHRAWQGLPDGELPEWLAVEGDERGGFWIGSHHGLHLLTAESGRVQHQLAPLSPRVQGGLGIHIPPGFRANTNAITLATARVADGVRARMRDRARIARLSIDLDKPIDFYTPSSRVPGSVTALCRDRSFLWVATTDGSNKDAGRIQLYHIPTEKWVGWLRVPMPVRCMAVDEQYVWLGLDAGKSPRGHPLAALQKHPMMAIPTSRWRPRAIPPEELSSKLGGLSKSERAVLAFFANDPIQVVRLLAPEPDLATQVLVGDLDALESVQSLNAEQLFLLAFAHDPIGLDQPDTYRLYLETLHDRFPRSPYAVATRSLLQGPTTPTPRLPGIARSRTEDREPAPSPVPAEPAAEIRPPSLTRFPQTQPDAPLLQSAASSNNLFQASQPPQRTPDDPPPTETVTAVSIMARRDLNRDGFLNLVELRLWLGPQAAMEDFDFDGDGKISLQELDRILKPLDADHRFPDREDPEPDAELDRDSD